LSLSKDRKKEQGPFCRKTTPDPGIGGREFPNLNRHEERQFVSRARKGEEVVCKRGLFRPEKRKRMRMPHAMRAHRRKNASSRSSKEKTKGDMGEPCEDLLGKKKPKDLKFEKKINHTNPGG